MFANQLRLASSPCGLSSFGEIPNEVASQAIFLSVASRRLPSTLRNGNGSSQKRHWAAFSEREYRGLNYTIPAALVPSLKNGLPQDPTGREHVILALWDNPRRTPTPRIVFLHDTKTRSSTLTLDQIGEGYLQSLKPGAGFKVERPKKVLVAGNSMWRMDYWRPDNAGQSLHSAFAVPLKDRKVLFIDMNASSRSELDALVDSLQGLKFDQN